MDRGRMFCMWGEFNGEEWKRKKKEECCRNEEEEKEGKLEKKDKGERYLKGDLIFFWKK